MSAQVEVSPPSYAASRDEIVATFHSGLSVPVLRSRVRQYPGLKGPAPDTRALYAGLVRLLPKVGRAIDLGCGAGVGMRLLLPMAGHLIGFEPDLKAVEFARNYLPKADVRPLVLGAVPLSDDAELVSVVDVLGHAQSPVAVLRTARRKVRAGGHLFLAEPRAAATQLLAPPARRAFSRAQLVQLLARSGFEAVQWFTGTGSFWVCLATASESPAWQQLELAEHSYHQGDHRRALELYEGIRLDHRVRHTSLGFEAMMGAAMAHAQQGQLDAACGRLLQAAREFPGEARPCIGLAEVSLATGSTVEALSLGVRALDLDPTDASAARVLALAAGVLNRSESEALHRIANNLAPDHAASAVTLAQLAAAQGELAYAIWILERLREFGAPTSVELHATLGWLYSLAGRPQDARLELELGLVLEPDSAALAELGASLVAQELGHEVLPAAQ